MGFFSRLFETGKRGEPPAMPWDQRPSIYDHIRSHVPADGPGLTEGGETLPDEERVNAGSKIRWAAGAMDGVLSHHMGQSDSEADVKLAVNVIRAYCTNPVYSLKAALYQQLLDGKILPLVDPILQSIISEQQINHERLYELAYSFVTEAPHREPVKFGIALLGLFRNPANESVFQTLGRHEEFTLYCCVALANLSEHPDNSLWALAKNVTGWGRIHTVERLAQTEDPEIRNWLLRDGFRNSVMYEYLAHTCAVAGDLVSALSRDTVDRELLTSAGELLGALIAGGPAESMDGYEDGAVAVEMYLGHMESSDCLISDFNHVNSIQGFLNDSDADWEARDERGWTNDRRDNSRTICERILGRPEWNEKAQSGLNSSDDVEFDQANRVAEALGMDTWEWHWKRLSAKSNDWGRWWQVMNRCNDDRINEVLELARRTPAIVEEANQSSEALRMGPMDCILQELRRFPGQGEDLIKAGLQSPVVRNRNMAVAALSAWGNTNVSQSMKSVLVDAARAETDDGVRQQMGKVINGESLEG